MREMNGAARLPRPHESAAQPTTPSCPPVRPPRWSQSISELAAAKRLVPAAAKPAAGNTAPPAAGNTAPPAAGNTAPPAAGSARQDGPGNRVHSRPPLEKTAEPEASPLTPPRGVLPKAPREPVAARLRARRGRWVAELRRGMPCWLTSMLVHLLVVIVLGSLVTRPAARRYLCEFVGSFSDHDLAAVEMTTIHVDMPQDEGPQDEGPRDEGMGKGDQTRQLLEDDDPFADGPREPSQHLPGATDPAWQQSGAVAVGHDQRGAGQGDAAPARTVASVSRRQAEAAPVLPAAEQRRQDHVVDRFIEFDVGRLPGEAGMQAKREFDALGPEAIPALVRGLNKAAHIRASCPVLVISRKLQSALESNHDRSLLDYAVENLGRDVPASAPYAAQVRALREHWAAIATGRSPSKDAVSLARELAMSESQRRLDATLAVIDEQERFNDADRQQLGWLLAGQLKSRNVKLRDAARQALVALSGGEDFGPAEKARPGEVKQAVRQWHRHFDARRFDAQARGLLDSAKQFDERKQRSAAMRFYRRVMTEYAGSQAAKEAAQRLDKFKPAKKAKPR